MKNGNSSALALGRRPRRLTPDQVLADRVRMVLETRPGSLPYRREFGCRLDEVVGQMATRDTLDQAEAAVTEALERWLPEVEVAGVTVRVVPRGATHGELRYPEIPIAERALLALGTQADIEVGVELRSQGSPSVIRTTLSL